MTRISSLIVATTLAILPISAFAQQDAAPSKTGAPSGVVSTTPANPLAASTSKAAPGTAANSGSKVTQSAKPDVQSDVSGGKTAMHGMNTVKSHAGKTHVPATVKSADPVKS